MSDDLTSKSWLTLNKTDIQAKINQGLLPHALLLFGSSLAGQEELGLWLSKKLVCQQPTQENACGQCKACRLVQANTHPDLQFIDNGEKTIGVDIVRKAGAFMQKTAHIGKTKVVLIHACENMTEAAANALLKTLEEPTKNSYLLLVCNDIDLLLPTIISRCSQIKVQPPVGHELAALINDNELINDFSNINQFAELTDSKVKQSYIEFNQLLLNWLQQTISSSELLTGFDSIHSLRWLSHCFNQLLRIQSGWQQALQGHALMSVANKYSNEQLWQCLALTQAANKQIKLLTQANKNFTIEALLVDIEDLLQQSNSDKG